MNHDDVISESSPPSLVSDLKLEMLALCDSRYQHFFISEVASEVVFSMFFVCSGSCGLGNGS